MVILNLVLVSNQMKMFSSRKFVFRLLNISIATKKSFSTLRKCHERNIFSLVNRNCLSYTPSHFATLSGDEIDYKVIVDGDEDLEHKLKVIALETEVMRQEGKPVPENRHITKSNWKELLSLPSRNGRRKYLEYLFKLSKKKENEETKKEERRISLDEYRQRKEQEKSVVKSYEDFALTYDLQHNNIFIRFRDTTINNMYNSRLIQAVQFGQKLVIDCGYDENMTKRENLNCAKQLMFVFAENRVHDDPFDLHYCNVNRDSTLIHQFNKYIPTMNEPWFPINIHEKSYLDVFPKDQLVYLTPHCQEEMKEFDHNAVYIIGGIVDKVNNEPLSLAKAKKEQIKMQKLPLDRYLSWGSGSGKSLTLNQVLHILLDVKLTGDWVHALRHVPRRKLVEHNIYENLKSSSSNRKSIDYPGRKKWSPVSNIVFDKLKYNKTIREGDRSVTSTLTDYVKKRSNFE